jgi:hypothetical protein
MQVRRNLWLLEVGYLFPYIDHQSNIVMSEDHFHFLFLWTVSWIYYNRINFRKYDFHRKLVGLLS